MLEVLIDGYKEECFKGGRFGFQVGESGAWLEIEDTLLKSDGVHVEGKGSEMGESLFEARGGGFGLEDVGVSRIDGKMLTGVEITDVHAGSVTGKVIDNDFGLVQFEEKV